MRTKAAPRRVFQSSELSRNSVAVLTAATEAPIEVTRRDADSLVMMTTDEFESRDRLLELAAQIIAITTDEDGRSLGARFTDRFDWMLALSDEEIEQCAHDIVRASRAAFATGASHLALAEMTSWHSTAQAVADGLVGAVDWLPQPIRVERPE